MFLRLAIPLALVLLLTGCIDTDIRIDMRNPASTDVQVNAGLQEAAIDVLTLQYPELRHGSMAERGKQLRTCEAFFAEEPRAVEVLKAAQPIERDGVRISKIVDWLDGKLYCGFKANGPAKQVLTMLDGSELIKVSRQDDRYVIQINTQDSKYANVPDLGFFESFGSDKAPPTLALTILGNEMASNYELGQTGGNRFELTENLMGKRQHFQNTFEVSVSARQPELIDWISAWWSDIWQAISNWFNRIKG